MDSISWSPRRRPSPLVGLMAGAASAALLALVVATGTPADAATGAARWQAKIGPGGANGVATVTIAANGNGTVSISLKHLAKNASYTETLSRGTCAKPSTKLVGFPSIRATSAGAASRTSKLTVVQASLVNRTGVIIRFVAGSKSFCGAFTRIGGGSTSPTPSPTPPVSPTPTPVKPATAGPSIPVGYGPQDVALTPTAIYVVNLDGSITRIDPATNTVLAVLDLGDLGNGYPTGIAVGDDGNLWVTVAAFDASDKPVAGKVLRVDGASGQVKSTVPVGSFPLDVAASPGAIWVVDYGDGTIEKVDPATNTAAAIPAHLSDAAGIAFGAGSVWVSSEDGQVLRIDPATGSVAATIPALPGMEGVAFGQGAVWVAAYGSPASSNGLLLRIDPATNQVVKSIPVGANPISLATGCGAVFVAMDGDNTVVQVDPGSNAVVTRLAMPGTSLGIAGDDHGAWAVQPNLAGLKANPVQPGTATRITC